MFAVAIDGPAGVGKSSVSKEVSKKLGFLYMDTGALYRAIGLYILRSGIDDTDDKKIILALKNVEIDIKYQDGAQRVMLCNEDVTDFIRTPEVTNMTVVCAKIPEVRELLFSLQVDIAKNNNVIMDGRDIGTVVLPNAQVKIFLTATAEERAKRRLLNFIDQGIKTDYGTVLKDVKERDFQDENRGEFSLKQADDALLLDSTNYTKAEVIEKILEIIEERL